MPTSRPIRTAASPLRLARWGLRFGWLAWLWWCCLVPSAAQKPEEFSPAERKAAVLAKLPGYVTWPRDTESTARPIIIGVVGEDPFGGLLERIVSGSRVEGRALQVKYFPTGQEIVGCDLLFVPASQQDRWVQSRKPGSTERPLTVGESDDFLKLGGMVRIVQARRYKLEIDLSRTRASGWSISSKLLDISVVIGGRG